MASVKRKGKLKMPGQENPVDVELDFEDDDTPEKAAEEQGEGKPRGSKEAGATLRGLSAQVDRLQKIVEGKEQPVTKGPSVTNKPAVSFLDWFLGDA